jgi:CII-binding regulator of phage lambda lysogenization HflD
MIIKEAQKNVFVSKSYEKFLIKLTIFISEEFPEDVYGKSQNEIENRLIYCVNKARSYGMSYEQDLTKFVVFCFVLEDNFDEQKGNKNILLILRDNSLNMKEKLDTIGEIIYRF